MDVIIGIVVGLILGGVTIFFVTRTKKSGEKVSKEDFFKFKKEAQQILVEKKNVVDKELQDFHEKKMNQLDELFSQRRQEFETEKEKLDFQLNESLESYQTNKENLKNKYKEDVEYYNSLVNKVREENQKEIDSCKEEKIRTLNKIESDYKDKEKELDDNFLAYSADISSRKEKLLKQIEDFEAQQQKIIERFKKDEEIRQQQEFYKISIDEAARQDIEKLKNLALSLSRPEVLYKLLYDVYYKTPLEELFKRVLGDNKDKGGIYKITNVNNQKVYIGKTVKFLDRWRTHAKRGCGIERIRGQLYDAMFREGLENFTFEIVEVCDKEVQSEREKYWTEFYGSNDYGFNSRVG